MKNKFLNIEKVIRIILAAILLISGFSKLLNPLVTIESIKVFSIFPEEGVVLIVTLLPIYEILLGMLLIINFGRSYIKTIVVITFFVFFAVSVYGYILGIDNDCGCFGSLVQSKYGIGMIIRNIIFLLLAAGYYKINSSRRFN